MLVLPILSARTNKNMNAKYPRIMKLIYKIVIILILFFTISHTIIMIKYLSSDDQNTTTDINYFTNQGISSSSHYPILTIEELIHMTKIEKKCPPGLVLVKDYWAQRPSEDNDNDNDTPPQIPRYIHVTAKTRCMTQKLYDNLQLWRNFAIQFNYSFLIHNDIAMEYLLMSYSQLYNPLLQQVLHCAISPTIKTDIWRAIVLYIYGGIYTDIDNAPGKDWVINVTTTAPKEYSNNNNNNNKSSDQQQQQQTTVKQTFCIKKTDEAFFVREASGHLSQYFMASKPNHILMRLLVDRCMERLLTQQDIYRIYIPIATGPNALRHAFFHFMNQSYIINENKKNPNISAHKRPHYQVVPRGYYLSPNFNYTVTVLGGDGRYEANDIVFRDSLGFKSNEWRAMNMTFYFSLMNQVKTKEIISCRELIIKTNNYSNNNYNSNTILYNYNNDNNNNNNESMIDIQIEEEIKNMDSFDITRQYLFHNEEIYHLKNRANIEYKTSWLSAVQMTRKQQLQFRVIPVKKIYYSKFSL